MRRLLALLMLAAAMAQLAGCGPRVRAVVVDRSAGAERGPAPVERSREAVVARGDTLYGIAFRHGVDFRELARWNGIGPPYTIYPGQRLRLAPPAGGTRTQPPPGATPPRGGVTSPSPRTSTPPRTAPPPSTPAKPPPARPAPAPTPTNPPAATAGAPAWRWPAEGELLARFTAGDPTRQGIDIGGPAGTPVRAAAAGEVVYSGSGLVGYGELIIVKHDDTWLSAYGHNRKRLVAEGERVQAGQQIAEMGRTGASRDMLHFEIRRNGQPVDPLGLLPRR